MNIDQAFPSDYLKAADFPQAVLWTMKRVEVQTVGQGDDQQTKPILYFAEDERGLVLNKTNAGMISYYYGGETDHWIDKKMVVFKEGVPFGGKVVDGIRVRAPKDTPVFSAATASPEVQAASDLDDF